MTSLRVLADQRDSAAAGSRWAAGRSQEQHVLRRVLRQGRDGEEHVRHHAERPAHRVQRAQAHGQVGRAEGKFALRSVCGAFGNEAAVGVTVCVR